MLLLIWAGDFLISLFSFHAHRCEGCMCIDTQVCSFMIFGSDWPRSENTIKTSHAKTSEPIINHSLALRLMQAITSPI